MPVSMSRTIAWAPIPMTMLSAPADHIAGATFTFQILSSSSARRKKMSALLSFLVRVA